MLALLPFITLQPQFLIGMFCSVEQSGDPRTARGRIASRQQTASAAALPPHAVSFLPRGICAVFVAPGELV